MALQHPAHLTRIGDRPQDRDQFNPRALKLLAEFLVDGVKRQFRQLIKHQFGGAAG